MAHANAGVLLVEDDPTTRRLEQFILEREGYAVTAVGSGEAALEALPVTGPSVVLLDVGLPGMDGFATCRRMRQSSRIPIIMVSARDSNEDKVRGLEIGADDYITKPFAPEEVVARVRAAVRRSGLDGGFAPDPRSRAAAGQLTRRGEALKSFWLQQAAPRTRAVWTLAMFRLKAVRSLPVLRSPAPRLRHLWSLESAAGRRAGMKHLANRCHAAGLLGVRNLVVVAQRLRPVLLSLLRAMPRLAPADLGGKVRQAWGRARTAPRRRRLERLVSNLTLPLPPSPRPGEAGEEAPGSRLAEQRLGERDRTGGIGPAPGAEPIRAGDSLPGLPRESFGFPPGTFLALLFEGYLQVVTRMGGDPLSLAPVTPLVEIHALLRKSLEGAGEYSREEFTRDVYRLHRSGVQVTGSGARVSFPISRGVAGKTLALTDEAGEEKRYFGVRFIQEEEGSGPLPGSTSDPGPESGPGPGAERANPRAPSPSGAEESDAAGGRSWSRSAEEITAPGSASSPEANGADAAEAELHGFYIIKSLLHDVVDVNRVDIRHRKGYSVVILDQNIKKPICRLRFGGRRKYLGLIDREKHEGKVPVADIDEIYRHADQLKAAVGYYEEP